MQNFNILSQISFSILILINELQKQTQLKQRYQNEINCISELKSSFGYCIYPCGFIITYALFSKNYFPNSTAVRKTHTNSGNSQTTGESNKDGRTNFSLIFATTITTCFFIKIVWLSSD